MDGAENCTLALLPMGDEVKEKLEARGDDSGDEVMVETDGVLTRISNDDDVLSALMLPIDEAAVV